MTRRLVLAGALLFSTPMLAAAQVGTLRPADEAVEDPSFFLFRMRLLEALAQQDTTFLYEHTAPDVHVSFGVESGLKGLKSLWRPNYVGQFALADPHPRARRRRTVSGRALRGALRLYRFSV